jgi:hypothetical protein
MTMHRTLMRGLLIASMLSSGLLLTATPAVAEDLALFCSPLRSTIARLEALAAQRLAQFSARSSDPPL